jgi:ubiquinone/menaquinone biosynthesis C-methylase UbiE
MNQFALESWDDYARCYDVLLNLIPYQELFGTVIRAAQMLPKNITVLDAACGTGNLAHFSTEDSHIAGFKFYYIDQSAPMLARAQEKYQPFAAQGIQGSLDTRLPFDESSLDCVISINTLYAVKSPEYTLREFYRVLRRGGKLLLTAFKEGHENGLILKAHCQSQKPDAYWKGMHSDPLREEQLLKEALPEPSLYNRALAVARYNRNIDSDQSFYFFQKDALLELLFRCGFTIAECIPVYADQCLFITATKESRS